MKLSLAEAIEIYTIMKEKGVVLYGAGKEGKLALKTLEREGICVHEIADQKTGKRIGNRCTVDLETLCKAGGEVCIVTPLQELPVVYAKLEERFDKVIDNFIVHWMAYFFPNDKGEVEYMNSFPFNHYESPFAQKKELEIYKKQNHTQSILDLNINLDAQLKLLPKLITRRYDFLKKKEENNFRYYSENSFFVEGDALLLNSIILEYHPHRVIEIGSGLSTCVMLDTREYWIDCGGMSIMCIEPYPERLYASIRDTDEVDIKESFVQDVDLLAFEKLEANDILFIDSSHVMKTGGDVYYEIFEILPRLKSGVLIHFHDIFYPFTYPEKWLLEGRAYNEAYILRALLMNSEAYEIVFWNDYMIDKYSSQLMEGGLFRAGGGSLWIRKR